MQKYKKPEVKLMDKDILQQILNELKELKENQNFMQKQMNELQANVLEIKSKVTAINEQTANLTEFQTNINIKLDKIENDLDDLTHNELQTEKELFYIKKKLIK